MIDISQNKARTAALPRTGRGLDVVAGPGGGYAGGGSAAAGGGSVTVDAEFDILPGEGVEVEKVTANKLTYTISHEDTSAVESILKADKRAIAGVGLDGFGHVIGLETCEILTLEELDKRYLFKYGVNDVEAGFITFEKGFMTSAPIRSAEYNTGWETETPKGFYLTETGTGWFRELNVRGPLLCDNVFGSPYFASGWTGFGTQLSFPKSFLELDNILVRKSAKFYELVIQQIRGTNGSLAVGDSNKIESVEDMGAFWRCKIDDMNGEMYMNIRPGDIIKSQAWKLKTGRYYMGTVTSVSDAWFDLSKNLLEGSDAPEAGDTVIRWDSKTDPDRKGLLYLTSSDSGAPYMDVRYGDWNQTVGTIKARLGRLDGINDPRFPELYSSWNNFGLYTENFYGVGELILRSTGESVSRTFEILKDSMTMGFNEIREEVYVSKDSVLQNPAFSAGTLDFWEHEDTIYPYTFGGGILIANGTLFSNVLSGAQIVTDEVSRRQVMQVTNQTVRQRNANFNSREPGKYAISFSYRPVVNYGSLTVGVEGSEMMVTVPLSDTSKWLRAEVTGEWSGTGDFVVQVSGGGVVNIVDISFANDRLTNAISQIKVEYDTKLSMKADEALMSSFRKEFDALDRVVREDYATQSWTATKIQTDVGTMIQGKLTNYSTISQTSQMINNKVADLNLGQYATTTWAANQIKNSVSNLNLGQYATTTWAASQINNAVSDKVSKTDLKQASDSFTVTIGNVNTVANTAYNKADKADTKADNLAGRVTSNEAITEAFYRFSAQSMQANRRIELGPVSLAGFDAQGGISPNTDNICFWAGGNYWQATTGAAKIVLRHDGSGYLAGKNISWDTAGDMKFSTASTGARVFISPDSRFGSAIQMYDGNNKLCLSIQGSQSSGKNPIISLTDYSGNTEVYRGFVKPNGCGFSYSPNSQIGLDLGIDTSGHARISGNWYSQSNAPTGCVYVDGNNCLKLKR